MAFKRAFTAALALCFVLGTGASAAENQDGQGVDSVIDKPPVEIPQYGRSNLPDSTMNGGTGFAFPGGGTTIPLPDPCATTPMPAYCTPETGDGGAGTPTPPAGSVEVAGDWTGCGVQQSGSVSYSFAFGSDGVAWTGLSTRAPLKGQWMPAGDNAARYSISFPDVPDMNPRADGAGWVNLANGVSGHWEARPSRPGMPAANRVMGTVKIREDATGAVISTASVDIYLTVGGECL